MTRPSFREQMLRAREDAIVESVNRLLAEKGFELMTVDEVAADVGIAKASLYKHFPSKESLAAAAMVRALARARDAADGLAAHDALSPLDRLREITRWTLQTQLAGQMPSLPSQNSSLRAALMGDSGYIGLLMAVSERLGQWIEAAQADGTLTRAVPAEVVLYTLYARACDPVPGFLKSGGQYTDAQIVEWMLALCFDGLAAHPVKARARSSAAA